jgi:LemA protein
MILALWIVIALAIGLVLMFIYYFNKFVLLGNRIDNSLSQIDVQLKRRADLIPNLMESVKGYMKHEKSIMTEVANARKMLINAQGLPAKVKAGDQLQSALGRLFAIAENYPQLKANENFLQFQNELSSIEDKIAYSRQFYNDSILSYNNSVGVFPGIIFAGIFGKSKREFLQISASDRANPKVKF